MVPVSWCSVLSGGAAWRLHALAIAARRPPARPWVLQPQRPRAPSRPRPIRPGPRLGARPSALKLPGFRERTPVGWSAVPFSSHRQPAVIEPFSISLGPLESRRGESASLGCIQQVTGLSSLPRPKTGSYFVQMLVRLYPMMKKASLPRLRAFGKEAS